MNKIPMTANGYDNLQKELKKLLNEDRPNIIEAIAEARSHGDLSENAEYQYAKEQQSLIEGKIQELETISAQAEIINVSKLSGNEIKFCASVNIIDDDTNITWKSSLDLWKTDGPTTYTKKATWSENDCLITQLTSFTQGINVIFESAEHIFVDPNDGIHGGASYTCLLYTSPSPRDGLLSRMPSSA